MLLFQLLPNTANGASQASGPSYIPSYGVGGGGVSKNTGYGGTLGTVAYYGVSGPDVTLDPGITKDVK